MLPFRITPTVKYTRLFSRSSHPSLPAPRLASNITPPESSEDEHGQNSCPFSLPPPAHSSLQPTFPTALPNNPPDNSDMDMADAQPSVSPRSWEDNDIAMVTPPRPVMMNVSSETPSRESQEAVHGRRVATPRWGHFRSIDMSMEMYDHAEDMDPGSSRTPQLEWNHRALLRERRLPSPISEDRSMVSSPTMVGVPPESSKLINATAMEQDRRHKDPASNERSSIPTSGKTMLSMGYRADCEKCRTRVPGHYNHVIRT